MIILSGTAPPAGEQELECVKTPDGGAYAQNTIWIDGYHGSYVGNLLHQTAVSLLQWRAYIVFTHSGAADGKGMIKQPKQAPRTEAQQQIRAVFLASASRLHTAGKLSDAEWAALQTVSQEVMAKIVLAATRRR